MYDPMGCSAPIVYVDDTDLDLGDESPERRPFPEVGPAAACSSACALHHACMQVAGSVGMVYVVEA